MFKLYHILTDKVTLIIKYFSDSNQVLIQKNGMSNDFNKIVYVIVVFFNLLIIHSNFLIK